MNNIIRLVVSFILVCSTALSNAAEKVASPDGRILVTVGLKSGKPYYTVDYNKTPIVAPSHLGFQFDKGILGKDMKITGTRTDSKDETWQQLWGEDETVRNHYNELAVDLQEKGSKHWMTVVFRVFNDGIGFRYMIHTLDKGEKYCIQEELTEIALAHDAKAWSIPTNHTEYFEGIYKSELLSKKDTMCTPVEQQWCEGQDAGARQGESETDGHRTSPVMETPMAFPLGTFMCVVPPPFSASTPF